MNNIVLTGGINILDKYSDNAHIQVKSDSTLNAININRNLNLDITIENDAKLVLNMFDYVNDLTININVISSDRSKFTLNACFICEGKYELNIDNNLYGSDIENTVNIRGINEKSGTVKILMNGVVAGETKNNIMNEYARIINKSDSANVLIPNLIVNTNEVSANHGVSIGGFRDNELFYLMSKGIDKHTAKKIIEEGFILSIMDETNKETIKNILIGR